MKKYFKISSLIAICAIVIGFIGVFTCSAEVNALHTNSNIDKFYFLPQISSNGIKFLNISIDDNGVNIGNNIKVGNDGVFIGDFISVSDDGINVGDNISISDENVYIKDLADINLSDPTTFKKYTSNYYPIYKEIPNYSNTDLKINSRNMNIKLLKHDKDIIVIEGKHHPQNKVNISTDNNLISIEYTTNKVISGNDFTYLNIYIPDKIINIIDISALNGLVNLDNVKSKDISIKTTNGIITLNNISTNTLTTNSTNGKINLNNILSKNCYAKTVNGKIDALDVYSNFIELKTTNGAVSIVNEKDTDYVIDDLTIKTVNGHKNIKANFNKLN